jgi:hypothetical protein
MLLAIDMNNYSLDNVFFNEQQKNSINDLILSSDNEGNLNVGNIPFTLSITSGVIGLFGGFN